MAHHRPRHVLHVPAFCPSLPAAITAPASLNISQIIDHLRSSVVLPAGDVAAALQSHGLAGSLGEDDSDVHGMCATQLAVLAPRLLALASRAALLTVVAQLAGLLMPDSAARRLLLQDPGALLPLMFRLRLHVYAVRCKQQRAAPPDVWCPIPACTCTCPCKATQPLAASSCAPCHATPAGLQAAAASSEKLRGGFLQRFSTVLLQQVPFDTLQAQVRVRVSLCELAGTVGPDVARRVPHCQAAAGDRVLRTRPNPSCSPCFPRWTLQ